MTSIGKPSCELEAAFSSTDEVERSSNIVAVITSLKTVVSLGSKLGKATDCCDGNDKIYFKFYKQLLL